MFHQQSEQIQNIELNQARDPETPLNEGNYSAIIFSPLDFIIIISITYVSYWTRNLALQFPDTVVFDEFHFGRFNNAYFDSSYFFDIHPPTAKLIIYGFSRAFQLNGLTNYSINEYPNLDYYSLRQIPALFASFCPPIIYLICYIFGLSRLASLTAAIMVICETSMIVEARFLLTDGILHFFTCLSILMLVYVYHYKSYSTSWYVLTIASGVSIGLAITTKYTSMSLMPLCAIFHLIQIGKNTKFDIKVFFRELLIRGLLTIIPIIIIFYISFTIHIMLLPYSGEGDKFMNAKFRSTLVHRIDPNWTARNSGPGLTKRIFHLTNVMNSANMRLNQPHPYSSKWYQWPLLGSKWLLFWLNKDSAISCILQPFNVLAGTIGIVFFMIYIPSSKKNVKKLLGKWRQITIFSCGYFFSYIPFALVPRVLFCYHYIIPLIFGILTFVALIDLMLPARTKAILLQLSQFFTVASFLYWHPFCYGFPTNYFTKKWLQAW